ncbi:MAG: hypothetical protein WCH31_01740 [Actinomycetes bacterium]
MSALIASLLVLIVGASVAWSAQPHDAGVTTNAIGIALVVIGAAGTLVALVRRSAPR